MVSRVFYVLLLACGIAAPAHAHHSFSAEFEPDKTAELSGKIVQVWWNNPHIRYRLQVAGEGGATEDWELQAASIMAPMRWVKTRAVSRCGSATRSKSQEQAARFAGRHAPLDGRLRAPVFICRVSPNEISRQLGVCTSGGVSVAN